MKIITLIENTTERQDLQCEHGLSLYIEANGQRILFDAGASEAFAANAEALAIDLKRVDVAVLSHGHNDHSGGFLRFLECNTTAAIYLRPETMDSYYNAKGEYIGVDPCLKESNRLRFAADEQAIGEGLTLYSCNHLEKTVPVDSAGLTFYRNGEYIQDAFLHEQHLLIRENGKRVLISGCSHKGLMNIARWFQPDVFIGGFHYMGIDPRDAMLPATAKTLLQYPTMYYTGHCTGAAQYGVMKEIMKDRLQSLSTGMTIEI